MQVLFNIILGVAAFLGGWVVNNLTRTIERLDKDIRSLPHVYVRREDYRDDIDYIRKTLDDIFNLINQLSSTKADK
jgi:flagellar biosynthesis/type III secretory pathway chaperone